MANCKEGEFEVIEYVLTDFTEEQRTPPKKVKHKVKGDPKIPALHIKTSSGEIISIPYDREDTITKVKEKINQKKGYPVGDQRIISFGQQIENDRTCWDYNIQNHAVLHLVLRLRGNDTKS